jgi:hypothetical protein
MKTKFKKADKTNFWRNPFSTVKNENVAYISILSKELQNLRLKEIKKGRINK